MPPAKFQQEPPRTPQNSFTADRALASIVKRRCGSDAPSVHRDLEAFGKLLQSPEVEQFSRDGNTNLPVLRQYSQWGERIDRIDTAHGWKCLKDLSATEGLIATGYERANKNPSTPRVHQFCKIFLFSPKSAMVSCPLAMTDGATRVFELLGDSPDPTTQNLKREFYPRLLSRDPRKFITSGQWMTEKPGGSDVGMTETIAIQNKTQPAENSFSIHGQKWFSSATDSDITFLLAREAVTDVIAANATKKSFQDADGNQFAHGSRGLSLFFAQVWVNDPQASGDLEKMHHHAHRSVQKLNGIRVVGLKDKFGTKSLPTAELELDGMQAHRFGDPLKGIKAVSTMLNITRIHAAVGSVGAFRHCLYLAKDFANKRIAFGKPLAQQPLQARVLADLEVTCTALTHACFFVVDLLGQTESEKNPSQDIQVLLRFLTPVLKAWGSKTSVAAISECMEALGGVGYIEGTGIGLALRDTQVNAIWEGATNVMSLDVLRVLAETKGDAARIFHQGMSKILNTHPIPTSHPLAASKKRIEEKLSSFAILCKEAVVNQVASRTLLNLMGSILASVLLVEEALYSGRAADMEIARRWVLCCSSNGALFGVASDTEHSMDSIDVDTRIAFEAKL
ncbi:hypothetical protein CcCBS67573_g00696 [Chytriomyces confervae]|uniref:Uncharacterized protein n=1 Tax=Chytriomyces confervae TaxID=246404 RepID=A0A507FT74_9FUNG|nr:hypothetical protein HDU80_008449 [Chytriomyces hyalinus]TPX78037.1 hypothetical protein CcCBS67573_g00696 [Chytriomyces confervae]